MCSPAATKRKIQTGTGMPNTKPAPTSGYTVFRDMMLPAPEMYWIRERKMDMVPRVAMKGANRPLVTRNPFTKPVREPRATAKKADSKTARWDSPGKRFRK